MTDRLDTRYQTPADGNTFWYVYPNNNLAALYEEVGE